MAEGSERNGINADQFAAKMRPLILELQATGAAMGPSRGSLHDAGSGPREATNDRAHAYAGVVLQRAETTS